MLLGAVVVGVALVVAFPLIGAYVVRSVVLPRLEERYGCRILVGDVSVRPTRVVLHRLHVKNADSRFAAELLTVPHIEVRYAPLSLLLFKVRLTEVLVEQAIIQAVRVEGDEDNVSSILLRLRRNQTGNDPGQGPGRRLVEGPFRLSIKDSVLDVRGEPAGRSGA